MIKLCMTFKIMKEVHIGKKRLTQWSKPQMTMHDVTKSSNMKLSKLQTDLEDQNMRSSLIRYQTAYDNSPLKAKPVRFWLAYPRMHTVIENHSSLPQVHGCVQPDPAHTSTKTMYYKRRHFSIFILETMITRFTYSYHVLDSLFKLISLNNHFW